MHLSEMHFVLTILSMMNGFYECGCLSKGMDSMFVEGKRTDRFGFGFDQGKGREREGQTLSFSLGATESLCDCVFVIRSSWVRREKALSGIRFPFPFLLSSLLSLSTFPTTNSHHPSLTMSLAAKVVKAAVPRIPRARKAVLTLVRWLLKWMHLLIMNATGTSFLQLDAVDL
jgi:hypothetical protein